METQTMPRDNGHFLPPTQDRERRVLVARMVETLGPDAAIRACRNSFWYGLADEIRSTPAGKPFAF